MSGQHRQIAVIGASGAEPGSQVWELAEEVGRLIAEAGHVLVCGGQTGVMEAASKGAAEAGGVVIGISPGGLEDVNEWCTYVIGTGIGHARNLSVVGSGEVVIAVGGAWGTLSEIGFARALDRTVVALATWSVKGAGDLSDAPGVIQAETAAQAVEAALEDLGKTS